MFYYLIFIRSYLFFKCFTEWRIYKPSLVYYSTLTEGNISLPVRYSYLSVLLDDYVYIFYASLLMLYCNFSCLILSSVVIINFYIISKRFFLRREELSDKRLVSITKKRIWFWSILFIKIHKVLKVNIWWMINRNLSKFSFVWNFHNKIVCWI